MTFSLGVLVALAVSELLDDADDDIDDDELVLEPIFGRGTNPEPPLTAMPLLDSGGPPLDESATGLSRGTLATIVPRLDAGIELTRGELTAGGLVLACLADSPLLPPALTPVTTLLPTTDTPTSVEVLRLPITDDALLPLGLPYPLGLTLPIGLLVPLILLELLDRSEMPEEEADRAEERPRPVEGTCADPKKGTSVSDLGERNPPDDGELTTGGDEIVAVGGMCGKYPELLAGGGGGCEIDVFGIPIGEE